MAWLLLTHTTLAHAFRSSVKLPPFLIAGSILANLVLAGVLFLRAVPGPSVRPDSSRILPVSSSPRTAPPAVDPQTWRRIDSANQAEFISRLHAEGFPPDIIRALARRLVHDHFRSRYQALADAESARPYWTNARFTPDPKINAERRALNHEVEAMMQTLLGPDGSQPTPDQLATLQHRFGNLGPDKLVQLQKIVADYTELARETKDAAGEILLPQDRAALALLQKENEADVARLLSPDELIEYELHHSSTANRLLQQLSAFDPTEEEFRALFIINHAIDAEYGNPGVLSKEERRARNEAQKDLASEIQNALGPDRYAAYLQATDPAYQQVSQLVTRLELPRETTSQVVALQKDIEQRMAAIRLNPNLGSQDRQSQFAALQQEATLKLTSSLGERGVEAYKNTSGYWLQNLQRLANRKVAPKP